MKGSGYIVKTKKGKTGRTYHYKGLVNGKVPVYLEKEDGSGYEEKAILCSIDSLVKVGYID
jgi:hypothetical protein